MVAERILAALTDPSAFRLQIAASIGVGWQASQNGSDHRALIKLADEAMYRAKAAGGGRALA
jgi:GGDEF domain-containing protein